MMSDLNITTTFTTANPNASSSGVDGGGCNNVGVQIEGYILPPAYVIDIILGWLGNAAAFWIFCFKLKSWKPNNMFLFNLVIADFLALVSLPLRLDSLLKKRWVFGDVICRLNIFLMLSNRTASIALMTVVAIYRYFKVVHPQHCINRMTRRQAALVLAVAWFLVIVPRLPLLGFSYLKIAGNDTHCFFLASYKEASQAIINLVLMHRVMTILEIILPLVILLFCSIRIARFLRRRQMGKLDKVRKAMRVCIVIVVVFVVCFVPSTVTTIGVWMVKLYRPWDCSALYTFTQLNIACFGLNFLNSALDPIIYVFSSSMFRKALMEALPRALRCGQKTGGDDGALTSPSPPGTVPMSSSSSGTQPSSQQDLKPLVSD